MSAPRTAPRPSAGLQALQRDLGHTFSQEPLLLRALTHRSAAAEHNERLEFLGDAVLNMVVSSLLFERYGGSDEGDLTRVRAHLVREESLHQLALTLKLPALLRLSEGEQRAGGSERPSILADAVEALIGATFIDGGYAAAQLVVQRLLGQRIASSEAAQWHKDPKTELQEWLQARRTPVPAYRIAATHGQAHEQTFEVVCEVPSLSLSATGQGRSRRAAEQEAARSLLLHIKSA